MSFNPLLVMLVFALLVLYPYAITAWKTTRTVRQCLTFEEISPEALPSEVGDMCLTKIQEIEKLGFQWVSQCLIHHSVEAELPFIGLLFQDSAASTYVGLMITQPLQPNTLLLTGLTTFLSDGRTLRTNSLPVSVAFTLFPEEIKQTVLNSSSAELWQAHQAKLAELAIEPLVLNTDEFLKKLTEESIRSTEFSVKRGELRWIEPGKTFRWCFKPAIKMTYHLGKQMIFKKSSIVPVSLSKEQTIDLEVQTFLRDKAPKTPLSKQNRGWIAIASLALFAAIYLPQFGLSFSLIFVGALILHEAGHLLAMLWFGYRAPAVLFIPFFGALATARKDHASLTEKVWISLAGPLPGLMLGIGIAIVQNLTTDNSMGWYGNFNLWRQASVLLIVLNLLNLLPIYPLDGGQIAELLLFSRNPYLSLIYKSFGVFLLLLLGLSNPLMFVFAALIALSIPTSFRTARWFSKLQQDLKDIPWEDDQSSARLIFSRMYDDPKLLFGQKNIIALGISSIRRENNAPWSSRLGLSLIYVISLIAGIIGGIYSFAPNLKIASSLGSRIYSNMRGNEMMKDKLREADRAIEKDPNDLEAYLKRSKAKRMLKDTEGELSDINYVLEKDPKSISAYRARYLIYISKKDFVRAEQDQVKLDQLIWTPRFQEAHEAIRKNPKDAGAYRDRATAKINLNDRKGAVQDYSQSIQLDAKNIESRLSRSRLYVSEKNYLAALVDVNYVIKLEPKNSKAYVSRLAIYQETNQVEKAEADRQKLKELFPDVKDFDLGNIESP